MTGRILLLLLFVTPIRPQPLGPSSKLGHSLLLCEQPPLVQEQNPLSGGLRRAAHGSPPPVHPQNTTQAALSTESFVRCNGSLIY
jgi:hypothetical protein